MTECARIVGAAVTAAIVVGGIWALPVPSGAAEAPTVSCVQDWRPSAVAPPTPPPSAVHQPFQLFCDGRYLATVWLSPFVNKAEGARLSAEIVSRISFPDVHLGVNPQRGITGLASWFWATPEASALRMARGNGPNLELEVRVAGVRWTFGEAGSPTDTAVGFGDTYPAPSSVQHTYERKGAYAVRAEVTLSSRYWLDQAPHIGPDTTRTVTLRHTVAEIRNLLHAR